MEKTIFENLNSINVNEKTEQKNGLTYLSWAWAWAEVKKSYPDASYSIDHYEGKPYLYDENLGYMVSTKVTIQNETLPMHLPVMDGANKAMKHESYVYKTRYGEKTCESASMFDINKTIMRCLVKNLAMFGLGLYIYAGEDLPEDQKVEPVKVEKALEELKSVTTEEGRSDIWNKYKQFRTDESFKNAIIKKAQEIKEKENGKN